MTGFIKQIFRKQKNYRALVFLDRDGTVIEEVGYLNNAKQLKILPKVVEAIQTLNKENVAVVVITNQPVIGHNLLTIQEHEKINSKLVMLLNRKNAYIDGIYACPHHPDAPNAEYKIHCHCRKPRTLLHKHALRDFPVEKIFGVIGDTTRDIQFGKNIKAPTVLVHTGLKGEDKNFNVSPDFIGKNLLECVNILLNLK